MILHLCFIGASLIAATTMDRDIPWYDGEAPNIDQSMAGLGLRATYDPKHPVPSRLTNDDLIWFCFNTKDFARNVSLFLTFNAMPVPTFGIKLEYPKRARKNLEPFSVKFEKITPGILYATFTRDNTLVYSLDPFKKDDTFTPYLRVSGRNNCVTIAFDVNPGVTKSTTIDFLALSNTPITPLF